MKLAQEGRWWNQDGVCYQFITVNNDRQIEGTVGIGLQSTIGDQCTIQCTNRTSLFSEVWTDIKGRNLDTVQMRIPNS